jgi:hypothetical protein
MKGVIFTEFLEMVEDRFSPEVVDDIIEASDLISGGAYTTIGTYDHNELLQLVDHLSIETNLPVPALVRAFGEYLFPQFAKSYPQIFPEDMTTLPFLQKIEGYIHVEVQKLYPDAELPTFEYHDATNDFLIMVYSSSRPLADLAEGLITGCMTYFDEAFDVQRENIADDGTSARFTLSRSG